MHRAQVSIPLLLTMAAALGCVLTVGCTDGRNLRRLGSNCGDNSGCASGPCYQGVCSKSCISDDECESGICVLGPNVCDPVRGDTSDDDANGVDSASADDAALASGACAADSDCLTTEVCAAGQCLVADTINCVGKDDGTSCANYVAAVTCSGGSASCGSGWTVAKYGGTPKCKSGVCTAQTGVPGWTGQSTCDKDSVCVPSNVGGVQPCQKRERVPACATTP